MAQARILGGYELFEEIARGGMGVVYRARQRRLGCEVAVKVLRGGEFAGVDAQRRFRREAAAAARLLHPGIVAIHEVGEDAGLLWYAMDLVRGGNLESLACGHPLSAGMAAECLRRVAEAVQHAHEHGVLHRDLKPSNILLDEAGHPLVADFGLARHLTPEPDASLAELTRSGEIFGTPGYAAPEQVLGGQADARTDVYGLGAVLYYLLTGRPPFQGPTLDSVVLQLRDMEPIPPQRLNPTVPRDLETICLQALRKNPAHRYASARDMGDDLARFGKATPIRARPLGLSVRVARWCRRRPGVAALLAVVAVLVATLVTGALAFAARQTRLERGATLFAKARELRELATADSRSRSLAALREAWAIRPAAELRTEAIACLALTGVTLEHTLAATDAEARPPAPGASADGRFTLRFENGTLHVVERSSGGNLADFSGFNEPPVAHLDDSARRIAIARKVGEKDGNDITLYELPSGKLLQTLPHALSVRCMDWAGELLAAGADDRLIYIWQTTTGKRLHRFNGHDAGIEALRFRPDGQELVSLARDSTLRVWHAAQGVEICRFEALREHTGQAWWGADGVRLFSPLADGGADVFRFDWPCGVKVLGLGEDEPRSENIPSISVNAAGDLAATADEKGCHVWSLDGGRLAATFLKPRSEWMSPALAGDGGTLWLSSWERTLLAIPITRGGRWPEFGPPQPLGSLAGMLLVAASRDGRSLALSRNLPVADQDCVSVLQPAAGRDILVRQQDPFSAAISPDSRWLVTGSFTQENARLWSIPDGRLFATLPHPGLVLGAAFTNRGKVLWLWGDRGVRRFDTTHWQPLGAAVDRPFQGIVPSPPGDFAASLARDEIILHRAPDLAEIARLPRLGLAGSLGSATLAFNADGSRLAVHAATGTVIVWDPGTLRTALRKMGMDW